MSTAVREFNRDKSHLLAQEGVAPSLADLMGNITERQEALLKIQDRLYDEAGRASRLAKCMRIAVILLGAFAATREVSDRLFVAPDGGETARVTIVVIYTLMALAITALGSLSAALGIADKASGLGALAAECSTHILKVDCEMPREGERLCKRQAGEARKLIHYQNEKISAIQGRAAKMGTLLPVVSLNSAKTARHTAER
jgi:hypothetical protein